MADRDLYSIIMAGGASSRFWPLCGDAHPKYLLKPDGKHTLIELALARAVDAGAEPDRCFVVTSAAQAGRVRETLSGLGPVNVVEEPARRDTAAAVSIGCRAIHNADPSADVLVLPADTLLEPANALKSATAAARAADGFDQHLHVFGVRPARAETGFGYIEPG
ncbi:MAG: sugar phosphate nucleotidyltransferase, partial [Nitrospira sp.]|nr:sugar phosphate nucleotidyltransferase [Nitrospira sp.]